MTSQGTSRPRSPFEQGAPGDPAALSEWEKAYIARNFPEPERTPLTICRDEDCPTCGWPETYAEGTVEDGPESVGCRKCGWTAAVL